ncbi:biliverdin-producing heme oxygenase [Pseudomonas sp. MH2]|uniref:Biliverdin-producing heme oxygenase n=1 Tax=Pseudomonas machongensis TaxID=3110229 RepID=A0ABU5VLI8_9PSED|nr:biliverdin-producing heme oxygenase [Pseudomonas sp. MH2]MEA5674238.1 biliverdin-producing heme oxygenase [Pseudomonas sp. MH2]
MIITSRPPPGPVLLALREGTQACHKSLEARLPFFSEGFDHDAYRRLIEAYYGFHAPLEALLATHQGNERNKAEALCRDLQALKLSAEQIDALPLCRDLPAITDEASALGVMYVLEGSTLGGQVLKRAMAQRLGIDADSGGGFLDVYGSATASHWRGFIERLDRRPLSPENQARAVAAAVATFTCFERWLEQRAVLLHPTEC